MKRILLEFPGHGQGRIFDPEGRKGGWAPFGFLRDVLKERGYQLETADENSPDGCAWVWFWDVAEPYRVPRQLRDFARHMKAVLAGKRYGSKKWRLYQACMNAGLQDRVVLFIGEPPVVYPPNWDPELHKLFPTIFTWNDDYVDGTKFHKFCWPVTGWSPEITDIPFHRRKLLVNISGNKSSSHPKELYSARRETIKYFEQHHPSQFDMYGRGWNGPDSGEAAYPSYKGTVLHKWSVFPKYRFGLCYENMRDEPGWVTEKIFDCMRAACVPVYWGASNITDYVEEDAFVDRREFMSNAELAQFLLSITEDEYECYQRAAREYLQSVRFAQFLPPAFSEKIIRVLSL